MLNADILNPSPSPAPNPVGRDYLGFNQANPYPPPPCFLSRIISMRILTYQYFYVTQIMFLKFSNLY